MSSEWNGALRERQIASLRVTRAHKFLKQVGQNPLSSSRDIIYHLDEFQLKIQEWERAQHVIERLTAPMNLTSEVNSAYDIRARFSDIIHKVESIIESRRIEENNHRLPPLSHTGESVINASHTGGNINASHTGDNFNVSHINVSHTGRNVHNISYQSLSQPSQQGPVSNPSQFTTPIVVGQGPGSSVSQNVNPFLNVNTNPFLTFNDNFATNAKLDKLKLIEFDGSNKEQWITYWEVFNNLVHSTNLPTCHKFTHLLNSLKGDAKDVIEGFTPSAANYPFAIEALQKRYGRMDVIIQRHIQSLLGDISVSETCKSDPVKYIKALWKFFQTITSNVRSLEALGVQGGQVETFLCPIILAKMPEAMRLDWFKDKTRRQGDLKSLLSYIEDFISTLDDSHEACSMNVTKEKNSTASALHNHTKVKTKVSKKCVFCNLTGHNISACRKLLSFDITTRATKIKSLNRCLKCLQTDHVFAKCKFSCTECGGRHNKILCVKGTSNGDQSNVNPNQNNSNSNHRPVQSNSQNNGNSNSNLSPNAPSFHSNVSSQAQMLQHSGNKVTVLQTAKSHIISKSKSYPVTILLDSGSDRSYVLSEIANKAKLDIIGKENLSFSSFGNDTTNNSVPSNIYNIKLLGNNNSEHSINAIGIKNICSPLFRHHIPQVLLDKFELSALSDDFSNDRTVKIDILIGLDFMYDILNPALTVRCDSLVAQSSVFGWVVSGCFSIPHNKQMQAQMCSFSVQRDEIKKFWELEVIGISPQEKPQCVTNHPIITKFNDSIQFREGNYFASLLWKAKPPPIINNYKIALRRTESLYTFLDKNPLLSSQYHKVFEDYQLNGKFIPVPKDRIDHNDGPINYLPHFPVIKEQSQSTKIRPVFDGSCKSFNGLSINDALETGPILHTKIFAILLRFRRFLFPVTGDLKQAFHSIAMYSQDQDVCRFLLKQRGIIEHFQFCKLPFGLKCSPFVLNAVIGHHLDKFPSDNPTIQELKKNIYVDDFLSGHDTLEGANQIRREATEFMAQGGFVMTKWQAKDLKFGESNVSYVLGLNFNISEDVFKFLGYNLDEITMSFTKRLVFSLIAKLYDPLGFLSPYIMQGRILMQRIWRLGGDWDDKLAEDIAREVREWILSSRVLKSWLLPRPYFEDIAWKDMQRIQIHGFGDASSKGYGCVVYLRTYVPDKGFRCSFVASKPRASPVKPLTIPRMELLAALLTARLVRTIVQELFSGEQVEQFYWTDYVYVTLD